MGHRGFTATHLFNPYQIKLTYSFYSVMTVMKDELCQTLSKEYSTDVNICLSSLKNIMNLEKPNSLWLIPVNILIGN